MDDCRSLHEAILRGEVRGVPERVTSLEAERGDEARAWALALRAAWWHAEPARVVPPDHDEVEALPRSDRSAEPIAIAAYQGARAAIVALDAERISVWRRLLEERGPGTLEAFLAGAFDDLLSGRGTPDPEDLRQLAARAVREQRPLLAVDAAVVQTLAALADEAIGDALAHARRASRMAQTEAMPQAEYLANVLLARCRRLHGLPHLATRILSALARVAPPPWHGWLALELALAGGLEAARDLRSAEPTAPSERLAAAVAEAIDAAAAASIDGFRARLAPLLDAPWPEVRRDGLALAWTLDADSALDDAPAEVLGWCAGATELPPRGLWGLSASLRPDDGDETALAAVLAGPDRTARRLLLAGVPLVESTRSAAALRQTRRRQGRLDTTIAVLALAGPDGLEDDDLFRRVYLFEYVPARHRGALDVLLHRVRDRLGDLGTLERGDGRTTLVLHAEAVIPDPRCGRPVDDRLLYLLATRGRATAKEAAKVLSVPLRTAQAALQELVEGGSCVRARSGNRVEDTTFNEPTRH